MTESIIVRHCSPTLAGLKTGNLFNYRYENIKELNKKIYECNKLLNIKGVYFVLLRVKDNRALIYVYRKKYLKEILTRRDVISFLWENGYRNFDISKCIKFLSTKLQTQEKFPHEIGVFLGYPLEDIKDFIKNKGDNCKLVGYWKVYNNEINAIKLFNKFKKCTDVYCKKHAEGFKLLRLAVAV